MTVNEKKEEVAKTGRELLKTGLVARTWGNVSIRVDDRRMVISPSGMGYEHMAAEDVPLLNINDDSYEGNKKPSSERKIHQSAMKMFSDVNFCVHTHQVFATAVGLADLSCLEMTKEEEIILEKVAIAKYASPGTDELAANVEEVMKKGARVILMLAHGVLVLGCDKEDAIKKATVLEEVCKRAVIKKIGDVNDIAIADEKKANNIKNNLSDFENIRIFATPQIISLSKCGSFNAQLDDMAQMLGSVFEDVDSEISKIKEVLSKSDGVMVKDLACIVKSKDKEDALTLEILLKKAAICKAFSKQCNSSFELEKEDCDNMRKFYIESYSKQK